MFEEIQVECFGSLNGIKKKGPETKVKGEKA